MKINVCCKCVTLFIGLLRDKWTLLGGYIITIPFETSFPEDALTSLSGTRKMVVSNGITTKCLSGPSKHCMFMSIPRHFTH